MKHQNSVQKVCRLDLRMRNHKTLSNNGIVEVVGSIPIRSTNSTQKSCSHFKELCGFSLENGERPSYHLFPYCIAYELQWTQRQCAKVCNAFRFGVLPSISATNSNSKQVFNGRQEGCPTDCDPRHVISRITGLPKSESRVGLGGSVPRHPHDMGDDACSTGAGGARISDTVIAVSDKKPTAITVFDLCGGVEGHAKGDPAYLAHDSPGIREAGIKPGPRNSFVRSYCNKSLEVTAQNKARLCSEGGTSKVSQVSLERNRTLPLKSTRVKHKLGGINAGQCRSVGAS